MANGTSMSVAVPWSCATGKSFTAFTVMDTVPASVPPFPSSTWNTNPSAPLKFVLGTYVRDGKTPESVPLTGPERMLNVSASPSGSEP